jgi:hypothetical protein
MNLADAGDPSLDFRSDSAKKPTSLRTSDRNSLLRYMGLPLHTFGKVSTSVQTENIEILTQAIALAGFVLSALSTITADRYAYSEVLAGRHDEQHRDATAGLPVGLVDQCKLK